MAPMTCPPIIISEWFSLRYKVPGSGTDPTSSAHSGCPGRELDRDPSSLCSRNWSLPLLMITHNGDYFKRQIEVSFGRED